MYFVMPHTPKMFFYLDIRTFVDVTWQNGSTEKNIPSTILKPISDLEAHDFFVHQYVVPNNSDKYEHVGVVKCVDHYEKTTSVRWIDLPNAEKIMSSCQLKRHPLYSYCNGNLVCRQPTKEIEISYLLCFGSIIGFKDGDIVVRWADGMASMVQPLVLHKIDGDDNYLPDSSESDETEVEDAMVVEIPVFHVDFLDFVDLPSVECLNKSGIHCISNDLEKGYRELEGLNLESIVDVQLLIYIPFKQAIKSHSLVIQAPVYNQEGS